MANPKVWLVAGVMVLSLSSGLLRMLSAHSQSNAARTAKTVPRWKTSTELESYGRVLPSTVSLVVANQGQLAAPRGEDAQSRTQTVPKDDLAWHPRDFREYFEKAALDLLMNPIFLLLVVVVITLFHFRDETGEVIRSLQSVKVGQVELVRGVIVRLEINDKQIHFMVNGESKNLEFFLDFPRHMETRPLHQLFVVGDLQPMLFRLRLLEARLAVQEDRLRSSPYFDDENPPRNLSDVKSRLSALYFCLGTSTALLLRRTRL